MIIILGKTSRFSTPKVDDSEGKGDRRRDRKNKGWLNRRRCLVPIRRQEVRATLVIGRFRAAAVEDNLLGESSFISRVIASFWGEACVHLEAKTTRCGGSLVERDVIVARNERETLNEPPSRRGVSVSRRLITHAITPQFAFRICRNAGKSQPACRMCVFRCGAARRLRLPLAKCN